MCKKHWQRWKKWGDPYWVEPKFPGNFRQQHCNVDGCDKPHHAHGYCANHAQAFKKHGNPLAKGNPGRRRVETPSYAGAHKRVRYDRGYAREYDCVQCGARAQEWALRPDISDEVRRTEIVHGVLVAYSVNAQDYQPMCKKCHRRMDDSLNRPRHAATGRFVR